ncbi:MAG: hypothetical protein AAB250_19400 [Bdellovibrionota bacterium]
MKLLMLTVLSLTCLTSTALADKVILPGERVYASGEYVSCEDSRPDPWPTPSPTPRPTRRIRVSVATNRSCLNAIPVTDGKDIAKRASRCDSNNPERRALQGDCSIIDLQVDHALAESVIGKANTIIYEHQKDTVRDAASDKQYSCVITL